MGPTAMSPLEPRCKLWMEQDGRVALSDYRLRLLLLIQQTGSLAAAAEQLGLSYRRAWGKVREIEATLGVQLVESEVGGAGGGRSQLTPAGADLVDRYARFAAQVRAAVDAAFTTAFTNAFTPPDSPTAPATRAPAPADR